MPEPEDLQPSSHMGSNHEKGIDLKPLRFYFIDNLRVLLTFLVIIGHAAITYGAAGSWFYYETSDLITTIIFSWLGSIGQSFAMALFFFLAGYFEPLSLDRKGIPQFIKERLIRLGISLLLFTFFLYALITWMTDRVVLEINISFIDDYIYNFRAGNFNTGPLWFVLYLLIFTLGYAFCYKNFHISKNALARIKITHKSLTLFIIGLGLITFLVRIWFPQTQGIASIAWLGIQIGTAPQYLLFFILGILAYRFQWIPQFTMQLGKFWIRIAIICTLLIPVLTIISGAIDIGPSILLGGFGWAAFLYTMNEICLSVAICVFLLAWSQKYLNHHGKWARFLANHAYAMYVFHAVFVVGLALLMRTYSWIPIIKWVVLSISAIIISCIFAVLIRKLPYLNKIF